MLRGPFSVPKAYKRKTKVCGLHCRASPPSLLYTPLLVYPVLIITGEEKSHCHNIYIYRASCLKVTFCHLGGSPQTSLFITQGIAIAHSDTWVCLSSIIYQTQSLQLKSPSGVEWGHRQVRHQEIVFRNNPLNLSSKVYILKESKRRMAC